MNTGLSGCYVRTPEGAVAWGSHRKKPICFSAGIWDSGFMGESCFSPVPPSCCRWPGIYRAVTQGCAFPFFSLLLAPPRPCLLLGSAPGDCHPALGGRAGRGRFGTLPSSPSSVLSRKLPFLPWRKPSCFLQGGRLLRAVPMRAVPCTLSVQPGGGAHPCSCRAPCTSQTQSPGQKSRLGCLLLPLSAPTF